MKKLLPIIALLCIVSFSAKATPFLFRDNNFHTATDTLKNDCKVIIGTESEETIYQVVEEQPTFIYEGKGLNKYLAMNLQYPPQAAEDGISGKVVLRFVVEADGSISNIEVRRSVDPLLDKEAVRVVSNMPKWTPGKQLGKAIRVQYSLPINFKLQD